VRRAIRSTRSLTSCMTRRPLSSMKIMEIFGRLIAWLVAGRHASNVTRCLTPRSARGVG
jgi:hypothetical protein